MDLYPHKFEVSITIEEYTKKYASLKNGEHLEDVEVKIAGKFCLLKDDSFIRPNPLFSFHKHSCFISFLYSSFSSCFCLFFMLKGRIMNKRNSSAKLYFYDIYGDGIKLQVMTDARHG